MSKHERIGYIDRPEIDQLEPSSNPVFLKALARLGSINHDIHYVEEQIKLGASEAVMKNLHTDDLSGWIDAKQNVKGELIAQLLELQQKEGGNFIAGFLHTAEDDEIHPYSINWTTFFIARPGKRPLREDMNLDQIRIPSVITNSNEALAYIQYTEVRESPRHLLERTLTEVEIIEREEEQNPSASPIDIAKAKETITRRLLNLRKKRTVREEFSIDVGVISDPYPSVWRAEAGIEPQSPCKNDFTSQVQIDFGNDSKRKRIAVPLPDDEASMKDFFENEVGVIDFYEPPVMPIPDQIVQTIVDFDNQIEQIRSRGSTRKLQDRIDRVERRKAKVLQYALDYQTKIRRPKPKGPRFIMIMNTGNKNGENNGLEKKTTIELMSPSTGEIHRTNTSVIFSKKREESLSSKLILKSIEVMEQ